MRARLIQLDRLLPAFIPPRQDAPKWVFSGFWCKSGTFSTPVGSVVALLYTRSCSHERCTCRRQGKNQPHEARPLVLERISRVVTGRYKYVPDRIRRGEPGPRSRREVADKRSVPLHIFGRLRLKVQDVRCLQHKLGQVSLVEPPLNNQLWGQNSRWYHGSVHNAGHHVAHRLSGLSQGKSPHRSPQQGWIHRLPLLVGRRIRAKQLKHRLVLLQHRKFLQTVALPELRSTCAFIPFF
mmetsp:Transcript_1442/g.4300  ORF Transcript_1442/g.4300 Transcript_1442/m.4300 type:complete len:238 (-) Transcript_1442:863-1576(-)